MSWAREYEEKEKQNQVEDSGGSSADEGSVVSWGGAGCDSGSSSTLESVVCSLMTSILIDSDGDVTTAGSGDLTGGEICCCCCCSCSYSLIRRFFNEWELFVADGDADEEIGDGLLTFVGGSTLIVNDDSCVISDVDVGRA